jgi:leader peptidase (prepilin peptidase)/N-methyltransferase
MHDLTVAFTLTFFFLGTVVGSFLSVLIHRTHSKEEGIVTGRSFCPHCKVQLKPYDMIPLLSYAFLRGKCRSCSKSISIHYFFLELLTGLVFAFTFLNFNFTLNVDPLVTIFWLIIFSLGIAIFFYDLKFQEIPLSYSIPLIVLGGLGSYFIIGTPIIDILIGAAVGKLFFSIQYWVSKGTWVGLGDSDIGLALGVILGGKYLIVALLISYILASIISIILLATKKATRKTKIAFGPFLIIGLYTTVLYGQPIAEWYFNLSF